MKNISKYIFGLLLLGIGFSIAWFVKPSIEQLSADSNHQHITDPMSHVAGTESEDQIWTCSMHPQVRQNEPGDCPICGMDLIPLDKSTSDDPLVLQMSNEAVKLANIQTTIVGVSSGPSGKTIRLSGKVQTDERLASSQVAHVPGRIEKLFVTFTGEKVNKGQQLATIYSPDLITAQRELLEAKKLEEINPKLLEAARNKLRYWKIGKETIEAIEKNGTIQETFTLYAEESGVVTNRRVAVGDYVKQGESLFDLMNLSKVWVLFDAYEEDLASIRIGDRIEFNTPSMPSKTFKTRISFIDPIINPSTRVASIRTEVSNKSGLLKPEMLVRGILQKMTTNNNQITVPKTAVLWTGTRSVIYVKIPDMVIPSYQFREIDLGEDSGAGYQVLKGLEAGEEVVTYGSFSIDAAAQLNNQASMMNKNVRIKSEGQSNDLPDYTETTPVKFKQQIEQVSNAYLILKDALVATDQLPAKSAATVLSEALNTVDMSLLKGEAHLYWMEQLNALNAHGNKIAEFDDIEEQRKQFDFLSQALIKTIKVFGVPTDTLYVQHCPMANENNGADWISKEKEIRNPYYGDKMLTCGTVKTIVTKGFKNPTNNKDLNLKANMHKH